MTPNFFDEYELVHDPPPANETPRQYLLRMTGYDFDSMEGCSWEDVRTYPPLTHWLTHVIMRFHRPVLLIRRKEPTHG